MKRTARMDGKHLVSTYRLDVRIGPVHEGVLSPKASCTASGRWPLLGARARPGGEHLWEMRRCSVEMVFSTAKSEKKTGSFVHPPSRDQPLVERAMAARGPPQCERAPVAGLSRGPARQLPPKWLARRCSHSRMCRMALSEPRPAWPCSCSCCWTLPSFGPAGLARRELLLLLGHRIHLQCFRRMIDACCTGEL